MFFRLAWPSAERSAVLRLFMRENMRSHSEVSAGTSNAMAAKRSTSKYFNVKSTFSFDPPSGRTERLTDYKGYCFLSVCCVYPTTMIYIISFQDGDRESRRCVHVSPAAPDGGEGRSILMLHTESRRG